MALEQVDGLVVVATVILRWRAGRGRRPTRPPLTDPKGTGELFDRLRLDPHPRAHDIRVPNASRRGWLSVNSIARAGGNIDVVAHRADRELTAVVPGVRHGLVGVRGARGVRGRGPGWPRWPSGVGSGLVLPVVIGVGGTSRNATASRLAAPPRPYARTPSTRLPPPSARRRGATTRTSWPGHVSDWKIRQR
jgi:hypothetical protein